MKMTTSQKWESKEEKKLLKPLMEKRRRDRMNQSLDRLRVLLLEATQDERLKNPKVEKAEILQKTVQFLKTQPLSGATIQPFHWPAPMTSSVTSEPESTVLADACRSPPDPPVTEPKPKEDSLLQRYHSGYRECLSQATHFLRTSPGTCTGKKAYLMEHICHCMEKITASPRAQQLHRQPPSGAAANPGYELQHQRYSPDVYAGCSPPLGAPAYLLHPPPPVYPAAQGLRARAANEAQVDHCGSRHAPQDKLSESHNSTVPSPQALNVWRPWP